MPKRQFAPENRASEKERKSSFPTIHFHVLIMAVSGRVVFQPSFFMDKLLVFDLLTTLFEIHQRGTRNPSCIFIGFLLKIYHDKKPPFWTSSKKFPPTTRFVEFQQSSNSEALFFGHYHLKVSLGQFFFCHNIPRRGMVDLHSGLHGLT